MPYAADFIGKTKGDVGGKHGILREPDRVNPRTVKLLRLGLEKPEDGFEIRNVFGVVIFGTWHRIVVVDDVVVAEVPITVRSGQTDVGETVTRRRLIAARVGRFTCIETRTDNQSMSRRV